MTSAAVPEIAHRGLVRLCGPPGSQWVVHDGTTERAWLPSGLEWSFAFNAQDFAYIWARDGPGTTTRWLSTGPNPILKQSLHQNAQGQQFVLNKVTGARVWIKDLREAFAVRTLSLTSATKSYTIEAYELQMPCDGASLFLNGNDVCASIQQKTSGSRCFQNAVRWWRPAVEKAGLPASHLRLGCRTSSKTRVKGPHSFLPAPSCSIAAFLIFLLRTLCPGGHMNASCLDLLTSFFGRAASGELAFDIELSQQTVQFEIIDAAVRMQQLATVPDRLAAVADRALVRALLGQGPERTLAQGLCVLSCV